MAEGYRIWPDRISTSYGTQPAKMETYSSPSDSSSFISRGTLTFKADEGGKECLRAHVVGSARMETKMMLDIDEKLFPQEKVLALQGDAKRILKLVEAMEVGFPNGMPVVESPTLAKARGETL